MIDCDELPGRLAAIARGTARKSDGSLFSPADRATIVSKRLGRIVTPDELPAVDAPSPPKPRGPWSGIGDRLHEIIKRETGSKTPCGACKEEIERLNYQSAEEVAARREPLATEIVKRAKTKAPKWWQRWGAKLAPGLAKAEVLNWIDEAVQATPVDVPLTQFAGDNPLHPVSDTWTRETLLEATEIIVKSFRRHRALMRFVRSVRRLYPTIRIRIVDDSFPDARGNDTLDFLKTMPGVTVHHSAYDTGLPAGRNRAVRESDADFVIVCDDDFVFTTQTDLIAMLLPVSRERADIVGGLVRMDGKNAENWCGRFEWEPLPTGKRDLHLRPLETPSERHDGYAFRRSDITFNFFAARRETLLRNPYDERYRITSEHLDSFLTWHKAGLRVAFTTDCIAGHMHDTSPEYKRFRGRNHGDLLDKKWNIAQRRLTRRTRYPNLTGPTVPEELKEIMPQKPNLVILTIGRCGSSILTKMLMQAGWLCPRADAEFAEHQEVREINGLALNGKPFPRDQAKRIIDGLPAPWVLKDPRFAWTLKDWRPLFEAAKPTLILLTRDMGSVEQSFRKQSWGKDGERGYEFRGVTLEQQAAWCRTYFDGWTWPKLHIEYEQLHAAMRLFDVTRGVPAIPAEATEYVNHCV